MSKDSASLLEARLKRSREEPIVGGLPDVPGIGAAMRLTPELGIHLRGLADQLLVNDFPGATISRAERELLATALSASNDCFFCMDSHAAHASAVLEREEAREGARDGGPEGAGARQHEHLLDAIRLGSSEGFDPKMRALLHVTRTVGRQARDLTAADVAAARDAGASDADVQLAVLIAAAFSMYNRMVDGLRARTPADTKAYAERAAEIAEHGYSAPRPMGAQSNGAPPRSNS
jgi:AhpD family alkylhydroperoxidase